MMWRFGWLVNEPVVEHRPEIWREVVEMSEIIVSTIFGLVLLALIAIWVGHLLANLWELTGGP